jgi:hypothetical protein
MLRISNKIWKCQNKMTQPNIICRRSRGFKLSLAHHYSEFFLEIKHQYHSSIPMKLKLSQQTPIWNLRSDAYFDYTSCYFKVVTLFIRNLFRDRLPHLLLIRGSFFCLPLSHKWGRYTMFSSCCDKESVIIFTTGRLPDVNAPWN